MIYIKGCWIGMFKTGLGVQLRSSSPKLCFTLFQFCERLFCNQSVQLEAKKCRFFLSLSIESSTNTEEKFVMISLT